jgi:predicted regulator of Ras-like GTPase activity (Roadblock/LC7/MglB family)
MIKQSQLGKFEKILKNDLIDKGVKSVLLIDMSGNIIVSLDSGNSGLDINSLAALAAGNYGAVGAMANLVEENEFSLLFHRGKNVNVHFAAILNEYLLLDIFNNSLSLGFLRLIVADAVEKITLIMDCNTGEQKDL